MALSAHGVSKQFATFQHRPTQFKERILRKAVVGREFWALRDVSTEVQPGETVGLIGANGSGKSTLLKIFGGILQPTTGQVRVRGRIASLLELGAGFNGELSGRENVYLNAAMLGLTRREVDRLFDDIIAFAELEDFVDGAVKHYSSGMYVRLGFAVAVHVDPDVLLVDEVLAVGDEPFAAKCLAKIAEFQDEGRTILCVSHSLEMIQEMCSRALVLSHGNLIHDGPATEGIQVLRATFSTAMTPTTVSAAQPGVDLLGIDVVDSSGAVHYEARPGDTVQVRVHLRSAAACTAVVRVVVTGHFDLAIFVLSTPSAVALPAGESAVLFAVPALPAVEGTFSLAVGIEDARTGAALGAARFEHRLHVRSGHGYGLLGVPHTGALLTER